MPFMGLLEEWGVMKTFINLSLVFIALGCLTAHADEGINKPGLIHEGAMICDALDCKFLPETKETPATLVRYEAEVGTHVVINGKAYILPGQEARLKVDGCYIELHAYLAKNYACQSDAPIEKGAVRSLDGPRPPMGARQQTGK